MKRDAWNRRYADAELLWGAGPNQFVEAALAELAPGRAIDLAAGEGRNAIWLAERGWQVRAVDFSEVALDRGRAIAERRGIELDWEQADLNHYEPTPRGYELVVIAYLQMPWEELGPILELAAAAVADGGTLLLVGHDSRNLTDGYGGPRSPAALYGPGQVAGAVGDLEIVRAETVERRVETDDGERVALDALVQARRTA